MSLLSAGGSRTQGGARMFERKLSGPEIGLIALTRVALGAGIGLLLSSRLNNDQRKAAGLALALFGALTTIPLAVSVLCRTSEPRTQPKQIA
jgi:hypothetical protein